MKTPSTSNRNFWNTEVLLCTIAVITLVYGALVTFHSHQLEKEIVTNKKLHQEVQKMRDEKASLKDLQNLQVGYVKSIKVWKNGDGTLVFE